MNKPDPQSNLKEEIIARADALGFSCVGFTSSNLPEHYADGLKNYIDNGYHGDMDWLANRVFERSSPTNLWPDARSVIVLGANYGPEDSQYIAALPRRNDEGITSLYAARKDYHDILKKNIKSIGRWLVEQTNCEIKVFVDTAPVLEKPLAQMAGIGWQGKHTNLVSRTHGSWLFLCYIFTTIKFDFDQPETDHCGNCTKCLDACPTKAFPVPYQLDARRCIAYLTIESKTQTPLEFRKSIGNRIFGCDDCLSVCPWNKFAKESQITKFALKPELLHKPLIEWLSLDEDSFKEIFKATPIKRTGYERFMRNVLIACGNAPYNQAMIKQIETYMNDRSPLIRGMAIWALGQQLERSEFMVLFNQFGVFETEKSVIEEWEFYLGDNLYSKSE